MINFNVMLIAPALKAGIKVPPLKEVDNFDEASYPHFALFCMVQAGRPLRTWKEPDYNAQLISELPEQDILELDAEKLNNLNLK